MRLAGADIVRLAGDGHQMAATGLADPTRTSTSAYTAGRETHVRARLTSLLVSAVPRQRDAILVSVTVPTISGAEASRRATIPGRRVSRGLHRAASYDRRTRPHSQAHRR